MVLSSAFVPRAGCWMEMAPLSDMDTVLFGKLGCPTLSVPRSDSSYPQNVMQTLFSIFPVSIIDKKPNS
jgi:hypothetical protein